MKSILIEMTKKAFGAYVKNKSNELIQIITDGDLRRNIKKIFLCLITEINDKKT